MAKGDKFYFENFAASTALSQEAAAYLVTCLENYDPAKIDEMMKKGVVMVFSTFSISPPNVLCRTLDFALTNLQLLHKRSCWY